MSEEVRIIITDVSADVDAESAPVSTSANGTGKTVMPPATEKSARRAKSTAGAVSLGLVSVREITPYITQAVNFQISQISVNTGNAELQSKAQALSSMAGTVGSVVTAGLVGGPYAAATAIGMNMISSMTQRIYRTQEIKNQKMLESETISLRKSRLGLATRHSRSGGIM